MSKHPIVKAWTLYSLTSLSERPLNTESGHSSVNLMVGNQTPY